MVQIKQGPGHGRRSQARLLGVARQGEAWARKETREFREAPAWPEEAMMRYRLEDVAYFIPRPHLRRRGRGF